MISNVLFTIMAFGLVVAGGIFIIKFAKKKNMEEDERERERLIKQAELMEQPSLFPCPDCGHMVSVYATNCPNCGRPLNPIVETPQVDQGAHRQGASGIVIFAAIVLGILVAVWIVSKAFHVEVTGTIVPLK